MISIWATEYLPPPPPLNPSTINWQQVRINDGLGGGEGRGWVRSCSDTDIDPHVLQCRSSREKKFASGLRERGGQNGTEMANATHIYPEKSKACQDLVHSYVERENGLLYLSCCVQDV